MQILDLQFRCDRCTHPTGYISMATLGDELYGAKARSFIISCSEMEPLSSSSSFLGRCWIPNPAPKKGPKDGGNMLKAYHGMVTTYRRVKDFATFCNHPHPSTSFRHLGPISARQMAIKPKLPKDLGDLVLGVLLLIHHGLFPILFLGDANGVLQGQQGKGETCGSSKRPSWGWWHEPSSIPALGVSRNRKPLCQRILLDSGDRHHVVTDHLGARAQQFNIVQHSST